MMLHSMSDLRLQTGNTTDNSCHLTGYYNAGDGGGGYFYWDAGSLENDNNGTIIRPGSIATTAPGRWKRRDKQPVNVKWFGAKGDGITDDTLMIQAAIDSVETTGGTIWIPPGTYMIKAHVDSAVCTDKYLKDQGGIALKSNTHLVLDNHAILKAITNSKCQYQVIRIYGQENVSIRGGKIEGERGTHTGTGGEWGYGIAITKSKHVTVKDIQCTDCWGDGINIQGTREGTEPDTVVYIPEHIRIENVTCHNNMRQGMSIEAGNYITVLNATFSKTNGVAPSSGIDIEPALEGASVKNVIIAQCNFIENEFTGLLLSSVSLDNVHISDCNFIDNYISDTSTEAHILTELNPVNIMISNCYFNGSTRAIKFMGGTQIRVDNNIFEDCGLQIGHETHPYPINKIHITNNSFYGKTTGKNISISSEMSIEGQKITSDLYVINNLFDASALPADNGNRIYPVAYNLTFEGNTIINFEYGVTMPPGATVTSNLFHSCAYSSLELRSGCICSNNIIHGSGFHATAPKGYIHLPEADNKYVIVRNNTFYQKLKYETGSRTSTAPAAITLLDSFNLEHSEFSNNSIVNDSSDPTLPMFDNITFTGINAHQNNLATRAQQALYTTSTAKRPLAPSVGDHIFDQTLNIPIFWDGTTWVNAAGTSV